MTEYDPVDERPLELEWIDTAREGHVWVSEPIASTETVDGPTDIRLAIKRDADEWVFWAEQWRGDSPLESISNTTYASEDADGMLDALEIIRDTVEQAYES